MRKLIRVLVANRPRFLRELILTTFSDQSDIEIVDEVPDDGDVLASVEKTNPDFVVIAQEALGERPSVCDVVLRRHPNIRIIAIVPHRSFSVYYWASIDIFSRNVEASEEAILSVLRNQDSSVAGLT